VGRDLTFQPLDGMIGSPTLMVGGLELRAAPGQDKISDNVQSLGRGNPAAVQEIIMKKQMKKLALSRETLAGLENNLAQVAGGITTACPSGRNTCTTCTPTCTTNLC
jgi:hypothetical protein